jgi:hypothetical protein
VREEMKDDKVEDQIKASTFIEAVKKLADEYDVELVRCTATDKNGTSSFTRTGKGQNQTMPRPERKIGKSPALGMPYGKELEALKRKK